MCIRAIVSEGRPTLRAAGCVLGAWILLGAAAFAESITLAWDPNPEPHITAYRIYVGTAPGVYTETFEVGPAHTDFTYTAAVSGRRYYFAVAAQVADSVWGPKSSEIAAVGATSLGESVSDTRPLDASAVGLSRAESCAASCVSVFSSRPDELTSVSVLPGGALMYVAGGAAVVAQSAGASPVTLLAAPSDQRIVGAELDPEFASNGLAYIAIGRPRDAATMEVDIVRHRYAGGSFGEPSTILAGLTVPIRQTVPFVVTPGGLLYVAAPATGSRRDPYAASVLVVDREGRTPLDQVPATPVAGVGLDEPVAISWDPARNGVWLAGRTHSQAPSVTIVRRMTDPSPRTSDGVVLRAVAAAAQGDPVVAVAPAPSAGTLTVLTERALLALDGAGTATRPAIALEDYGTPTGVSVSADGRRFVVVRRRPSDGGGFSILSVPPDAASTR